MDTEQGLDHGEIGDEVVDDVVGCGHGQVHLHLAEGYLCCGVELAC